ncbi:MAG: SAM-dependent methyltransferase [Bacteriovoracaceae bacterium]|nr:SAM-dependent methyltransferase [Bacteriovoracaceae bacterium]
MKGILTLIPTPIDEENQLEACAKELLQTAFINEKEKSIFVVEEHKAGRRRWIRFGLPREAVEDFFLYNEHNNQKSAEKLLLELKSGKNIYLMSDGGLPAFCDPGRILVDLCHKNKIKVTATPFPNSIILALSMSGFESNKFVFEGFLPREKKERMKRLNEILKDKRTLVLMDTPYRLERILDELKVAMKKHSREIFLAMDIGSSTEELLRGTVESVLKRLKEKKREFVIVINACV